MAVLCVSLTLVAVIVCYDNGVGRLPAMGWNTWCTEDICGLRDKCNEREIRSIADALVSTGMSKLGYEYVNMDDCWSAKTRDAEGRLQPNADRFPGGMKALADYVHSKGLKIGLYTCIGTETCRGGLPGSYDHYEVDAQTMAHWGIDFVKCDNCHKPAGHDTRALFGNFSAALNATGRPMLFSLCEWGRDNVVEWGHEVGQMLRVQMDHLPMWELPTKAAGEGFGQGTADEIAYMASIKPSLYSRPYGYLDPDFLETMFPLTMPFHDSRTEFSFWALWSSPLIVSTDIRHMSLRKKSILMNEEVIAIDQDELGKAGDRVASYGNKGEVWVKELAGGDRAVILFNPHEFEHVAIPVTWDQLGWEKAAAVAVRDLWKHADVGTFVGGTKKIVRPHDVFMFRASRA